MQNAHNELPAKPEKLTRVSAYNELSAKIEALAAELIGVTFGYLGNCDVCGGWDDRIWYVFLPHPGRVGTYSDRVEVGRTAQLAEGLEKWERIEARARLLYRDGTLRQGPTFPAEGRPLPPFLLNLDSYKFNHRRKF